MNPLQPNKDVEDITTFVVMKKLLERTTDTIAYKLGLVDRNGLIVKEPVTDIEKEALTSLDRLIFQLKSMIGGRINRLSRFQYTRQLSDSPKNYLIARGKASSMSSVVRVKSDLEHGLYR